MSGAHFFILLFLLFTSFLHATGENSHVWKINTSNSGKLDEYRRLFAKHGAILDITTKDLPEIISDPLTVAIHKASQFEEEYVIVEDTSLEVEDAIVGINVRWLLDNLPAYAGKKAIWTVFLAYRKGEDVYVHKGTVHGTIVEPRGTKGFGFDPVFLPHGATKTLAEDKPDSVNARAYATDSLFEGEPFAIRKAILDWDGEWQHEE